MLYIHEKALKKWGGGVFEMRFGKERRSRNKGGNTILPYISKNFFRKIYQNIKV